MPATRANRPRAALPLRLACAIALALPVPVAAGLYKCARDDGTVMYQEDPCPAGKELRDFERDPATVSVVPFRAVPGTETRGAGPRAPPGSARARRKDF